MRLHKFLLTATVAAVFTMSAMPSSADIVTFDFRDDVEGDPAMPTAASMLVAAFDGGAAGSTVTVDGLTVTAVEIIG